MSIATSRGYTGVGTAVVVYIIILSKAFCAMAQSRLKLSIFHL